MGWSELEGAKRIADNIPLESILATIRNALAHGNIFVKGKNFQNINEPIEGLVFLSEKRKDKVLIAYNFLTCSPDEFKILLLCWFQFLEGLELPQDIIPESNRFNYHQLSV